VVGGSLADGGAGASAACRKDRIISHLLEEFTHGIR
jgi:hypothetical protein